jgi:mRNA-degrading endonuclease RelE of RelBE toxin-antitoxin system
MYDLFLEPEVHAARHDLPGNMRQRIRRTIDALANEPRPPESRLLDTADLDLPPSIEIRRVRLERWRIVYAVHDDERWVWVLRLYRRPPYDYANLPDIARKLTDQ